MKLKKRYKLKSKRLKHQNYDCYEYDIWDTYQNCSYGSTSIHEGEAQKLCDWLNDYEFRKERETKPVEWK